ncbi:hypothetical protein JB92DRAFT_3037493 [Gautieria morchelliformis]|nr:hypothetical protein JB92DRAFT_3037493 [Gautieria morchelliformis]
MNRLPGVPSLKTTVVLRNVPRTALVSDVRRLLLKNQVENVQNVYIDHHRFLPVGKAFVTFAHPSHVQPAFHQLRTAQMSGFPLDVVLTHTLHDTPGRSRGVKGRDSAVNRGVTTGNGPDAGVRERGRNVVVWGLPGKLTVEGLKEHLRSFRLAGSVNGEKDVIKLAPDGRATFTSRYYVRTISVSEAHRLVRQLHMTRYTRAGPEYTMRARVVY